MILRRLMAMHLPSELRAELVEVECIPRTANGKFRPIVSLENMEASAGA